jgi:soluble lytic murein transglycosylase-like protein
LLDLPDLKEYDVPKTVMSQCVQRAAKHYEISPFIIQTVVDIEGGKIGTVRKNTNGTYDLGVMQLNTVNFNKIKKRFPNTTYLDLILKPCVNIYVGVWFLSESIKNANNNLLKGVGNYHSKTPSIHATYLKRFLNRYRINISEYLRSKKG